MEAAPQHQQVTLANLKGGAVEEMFARALQKTLDNIADLNTEHEVVRKITIEAALVANKDRDTVAINVTVNTKLPGARPEATTLFVGRVAGKFVAVENDPKQISLLQPQEPAGFPRASGERK